MKRLSHTEAVLKKEALLIKKADSLYNKYFRDKYLKCIVVFRQRKRYDPTNFI